VKTLRFALILVGLGLVPRASVTAQQTAPLSIEDLLNTREFGTFSPVQFSPDGKWVVYTTRENRTSTTADVKEEARTGVPFYVKGDDVSVVTIDSREARNLTGGKGANWAPEWSPDGRYLATAGPNRCARLWDLSSGQSTELRPRPDLPQPAW